MYIRLDDNGVEQMKKCFSRRCVRSYLVAWLAANLLAVAFVIPGEFIMWIAAPSSALGIIGTFILSW